MVTPENIPIILVTLMVTLVVILDRNILWHYNCSVCHPLIFCSQARSKESIFLRDNSGQNILEQRKIYNSNEPPPFTPDSMLLDVFQLQDANQHCFGGKRGRWKYEDEKN